MKSIRITLTLLVIALVGHTTTRAQDPLPSWNDGPAKQAIVDFVRTTTETGGARFVPPDDEAKKDGWFVISMKNDWKRIFAFEN